MELELCTKIGITAALVVFSGLGSVHIANAWYGGEDNVPIKLKVIIIVIMLTGLSTLITSFMMAIWMT